MTVMLPERLFFDQLPTPIGDALLITDEAGFLRALDWQDHEKRMQRLLRLHYGALSAEPGVAPENIRSTLQNYFAGDLDVIRTIKWRTNGSPFQQSVWQALCRIPAGGTLSYGELAKQLGLPKAARAVGLANGSNPVGLVVPCHRVIGANGSLTGYGGGLERKRWLLTHEGAAFRDLPLWKVAAA